MIVEDTFDCPLEVGSLVTYAMKREGGIIFPVCRIVAINATGWLQLEFEPTWLKEFNAPGVKMILDVAKAGAVNLDTIDQLRKNILGMRLRTVSPKSVIRIDTHPAFQEQETYAKLPCACGGGGMGHDRDCPRHQVSF